MIEVIENALPQAILNAARAAWPEPTWSGWHRYKGTTADKYGTLHYSLIPPACGEALRQLASVVGAMLPNDCFIDYEYHAAGLHQIPPGGFLGRHLDAEQHPMRQWERTHSAVLFLDTIPASKGGELYVENPYTLIQPKANRCAVFSTAGAWHGVHKTDSSAPVRRTLALFAWRHSARTDRATAAVFQENQNADNHSNRNRACCNHGHDYVCGSDR